SLHHSLKVNPQDLSQHPLKASSKHPSEINPPTLAASSHTILKGPPSHSILKGLPMPHIPPSHSILKGPLMPHIPSSHTILKGPPPPMPHIPPSHTILKEPHSHTIPKGPPQRTPHAPYTILSHSILSHHPQRNPLSHHPQRTPSKNPPCLIYHPLSQHPLAASLLR
ncbi:protein TRACHEARY ELEMENT DIFFERENTIATION-RELATED 7A-like, partial [Penaeus japonicus]|uniref:protein TRACHEARY ELEMENT DIFFERENTIATION-RELATED 7A-like n=1 Tax=Penaeus japonicus TaxID=27405 RepID=UPI001C710455